MTGLQGAVTDVAGVAFPGRNEAQSKGPRALLWMSPDELMLVVPHADAGGAAKSLVAALGDMHSLVVDVSDARAVFTLEGEAARLREVLAKLSPADLRPGALPVGTVRRTRLAQVPAAFWFAEDGRVSLVCFRSVAGYVFDLLSNAAQPGAEVGHF